MTPVQAQDVGKHLELLRNGIAACAETTGQELPVEHVYHLLVSGKAYLYLVGSGFAILQIEQDFDGPVLFVWALWAPGQMHRRHEIMRELEGIGRACKCVGLRMQSTRTPKAWQRLGFREVNRIYERHL